MRERNFRPTEEKLQLIEDILNHLPADEFCTADALEINKIVKRMLSHPTFDDLKRRFDTLINRKDLSQEDRLYQFCTALIEKISEVLLFDEISLSKNPYQALPRIFSQKILSEFDSRASQNLRQMSRNLVVKREDYKILIVGVLASHISENGIEGKMRYMRDLLGNIKGTFLDLNDEQKNRFGAESIVMATNPQIYSVLLSGERSQVPPRLFGEIGVKGLDCPLSYSQLLQIAKSLIEFFQKSSLRNSSL